MNKTTASKSRLLNSIENHDGSRCVDVFQRSDRSFGYEENRRDARDGGLWTAIGNFFSERRFGSAEQALAAAARSVPWLD